MIKICMNCGHEWRDNDESFCPLCRWRVGKKGGNNKPGDEPWRDYRAIVEPPSGAPWAISVRARTHSEALFLARLTLRDNERDTVTLRLERRTEL